MTAQDTFIARLRRHRERQHILLEEIAAEVRIKQELLEAFERGDLSAWPRGVYARAWVRAYASAIGMDPIDTVDEFCRLFPHGDRRAGGTVRELAAIMAHTSEYRDEISHPDRRRSTPQINVLPKPTWQQTAMQLGRTFAQRINGLLSVAFAMNRPHAISRVRAGAQRRGEI